MTGTVRERAELARQASRGFSAVSDEARRRALSLAAQKIGERAGLVLRANEADLEAARAEGLAGPLLSRLALSGDKINGLCEGLLAVAGLSDPLHQTQIARELSEGLSLYRVSCPIGVVGVIFESRPDALVQIASLCIRSGNAALLKGGRESIHTCRELFLAMAEAAREAGLPEGWGTLLTTREDVAEMLALDELVDLIIPRGSNDFVRYIKDHSRIPVLGHADGRCHVYVDSAADVDMAVRIAVDAKTQYPAVCNAMETLLVHRDAAKAALPRIAEALREKGVALLGCERTRAVYPCDAATEGDWDTEYLGLTLSIKVVDSLEEAIDHINRHGSGHTDAIVTADEKAAKRFCGAVDSAGVYWNCSTRFADGFRYGFGAEVGIATGKLHARGPMGLEGLCTYKYKLVGTGQTVGEGVSYTFKQLSGGCPLEDEARC